MKIIKFKTDFVLARIWHPALSVALINSITFSCSVGYLHWLHLVFVTNTPIPDQMLKCQQICQNFCILLSISKQIGSFCQIWCCFQQQLKKTPPNRMSAYNLSSVFPQQINSFTTISHVILFNRWHSRILQLGFVSGINLMTTRYYRLYIKIIKPIVVLIYNY